MAFQIKVGITNDDPRVVDKSFNETFSAIGTLRNEVSLISPRIEIDISGYITDDLSYDEVTGRLLLCNYCHIILWKRWYYIRDIIFVRTNIFELVLEIDALKTYNSQIRQCTAFVERNQYDYDLSIYDSQFPLSSIANYDTYVSKKITDKIRAGAYIVVNSVNSKIPIWLTDKDDSTGRINMNSLPFNKTTIQWIFDSSSAGDMSNLVNLFSKISTGYEALNTCILDIRIYPHCDLIANLSKDYIPCYIGSTDMLFNAYYIVPTMSLADRDSSIELTKSVNVTFSIVDSGAENRGDFRNLNPVRHYKLFLPYLGLVDVDSSDINYYGVKSGEGTKFLTLKYIIDIINGTLTYYLYGISDIIINSWSCSFGVSIPVTSDGSLVATLQEKLSSNQYSEQIANNSLRAIGGIFSAVGGVTSAAQTGNIGAGISDVASGLTGFASGIVGAVYASDNMRIENHLIMPQGHFSSASSGALNNEVMYPESILAITISYPATDTLTNFAKVKGLLCRRTTTLTNFTGYTVCGNIILNNTSATITEKAIIKDLMQKGVYL